MITVGEIEEIMEDKNITFMPPKDDIIEWTRENFGKANLTAVVVIDKFIAFVQEWNDKDLSSGNEAGTIDKPMDNYYSKCCNADILLNVCDEGTHYAICTMCHSPCDVVKDE